jgi:hypothetical protein
MNLCRPGLVFVALLMCGCGGGNASHSAPAIPSGGSAGPSAQNRVPLVFTNPAKHQVYVFPSSALYVLGGGGATVVSTSGKHVLTGATLQKSAGKYETVRTPDAHARGTRTWCSNYTETYQSYGNVITWPAGSDYYTIVNVWQTEESTIRMSVGFTQRDANTVLYSSGSGADLDGGGQWEIYMDPGVPIEETAGGGAAVTIYVEYGHPGDPYYNADYGSASAVVTC